MGERISNPIRRVYGSDTSTALNVVAAAILLIWLYGTLALAGRRSGYAIMLVGSVVGMVVFTVHVSKSGGLAAGKLAESSGAFFFVWTLLALAVSSAFSAIKGPERWRLAPRW